MGLEIQVSSLEEMCDLMCDNKLPDHKEKYNEQGEMFVSEAIKILRARAECLERSVHSHEDCVCERCDECDLNYEQGTVGEQIEALKMAVNIIEEVI